MDIEHLDGHKVHITRDSVFFNIFLINLLLQKKILDYMAWFSD